MSKESILVADDDEKVVQLISLYLRREGFSVIEAFDGEEALRMHRRHRPHLVILDIMMPKRDGWEVARNLRAQFDTPIIMLTARDDDHDKVLGLELGADDYVTKPFNPRELIARVRAVLRRTASKDAEVNSCDVRHGNMYIDREKRYCEVGGREVALTVKEFDLLWLLASNPRRVFSREQFLEKVWGYDYAGDTRTVDTHIKRLRNKLDQPEQDVWQIETVWGVGYRFRVDEKS